MGRTTKYTLLCLGGWMAAILFCHDKLFAQAGFAVTRDGVQDTLFFVQETGAVGVGMSSTVLPWRRLAVPGRPGLPRQSRFTLFYERPAGQHSNYAGLSSIITAASDDEYQVNLVGLFGLADGTSDSTTGVYGRASGRGMLPSVGGYFEAEGHGMGENIGGYFSSRGFGPTYGIWADAGGVPAVFNRYAGSGALLSYRVNRSEIGSVWAYEDVLAYENLRGVRLAVTNEEIDRGLLVISEGQHVALQDPDDSPEEVPLRPLVRRNEFTNDPRVVGVHLATRSDDSPDGMSEVAFSHMGEAEVWVIDMGEDLAVGDHLVTSFIRGHAMKDPGTFDVSYVVARVLEPVRWRSVEEWIGDRRRRLVSVALESQVVNHAARRLKQDVILLQERVERLEELMRWIDFPPGVESPFEIDVGPDQMLDPDPDAVPRTPEEPETPEDDPEMPGDEPDTPEDDRDVPDEDDPDVPEEDPEMPEDGPDTPDDGPDIPEEDRDMPDDDAADASVQEGGDAIRDERLDG